MFNLSIAKFVKLFKVYHKFNIIKVRNHLCFMQTHKQKNTAQDIFKKFFEIVQNIKAKSIAAAYVFAYILW